MSRILVSANEVTLSPGVGSSTTVDNGRAVRVYNNSGAVAVIYVTDSVGSGIGSVTMKNETVEIIEKRPDDYFYYTGSASILVARVGITQ